MRELWRQLLAAEATGVLEWHNILTKNKQKKNLFLQYLNSRRKKDVILLAGVFGPDVHC